MNCETCKAKIPSLRTRLNRVNEALAGIGSIYYHSLGNAVYEIDSALEANGFAATEWDGTVYGNTRRVNEEVGDGKYVHISLYRLESGRWEVVAYVN